MFETAHHHILALQSLDEHTVLDGLLEGALHPGVFRTDIFRQLAHLTDIDLADSYEDGDDSHGDEGQHCIHREEVTKSAKEHGENGQRVGDGLREEVDDIGYIKL